MEFQRRFRFTESAPRNPISPYGRSKLACEQILADVAAASGLSTACLRYFNAAGADPEGELVERHDPETHLISLAIDAARGQGPALPLLGTDYATADGICERDFIHVCDLARAHVAALRALHGLEQATRAQQMDFRQKLQTPMEVIPSCARSGQDDGSTAYPLFLLKRELSVNEDRGQSRRGIVR